MNRVKMNVFNAIILTNFVLVLLTWNENLILMLFILLGFVLLHRKLGIWDFTEKFPGPKYQWPTGNTSDYKFSNSGFLPSLRKNWRNFGCTKFRNWFFHECYVVLPDYNDIKKTFEQTGELEDIVEFRKVWPWIDDGLLSGSGMETKLLSKKVSPIFNTPSLIEKATMSINNFSKEISQYRNATIVDVKHLIKFNMFQLIFEISTGQAIESALEATLFDSFEMINKCRSKRIFSFWKRNDLLYRLTIDYANEIKALKPVSDYLEKMIETRRLETHLFYNGDNRNNNSDSEQNVNEKSDEKQLYDNFDMPIKELNVLNSLLEDFDNPDIVEKLINYISTSYDRLASVLTFAIHELSKNQQNQERVFKNYKDNGVSAFDAVIRETMKTHNPIPIICRHLENQGIALNGYFVPPNSNALLFLEGINERKEISDSWIYDEQCLSSQILKTFLGKIIQNFRLSEIKQNDKNDDLILGKSLHFKNDLKLKLEPRN